MQFALPVGVSEACGRAVLCTEETFFSHSWKPGRQVWLSSRGSLGVLHEYDVECSIVLWEGGLVFLREKWEERFGLAGLPASQKWEKTEGLRQNRRENRAPWVEILGCREFEDARL